MEQGWRGWSDEEEQGGSIMEGAGGLRGFKGKQRRCNNHNATEEEKGEEEVGASMSCGRRAIR